MTYFSTVFVFDIDILVFFTIQDIIAMVPSYMFNLYQHMKLAIPSFGRSLNGFPSFYILHSIHKILDSAGCLLCFYSNIQDMENLIPSRYVIEFTIVVFSRIELYFFIIWIRARITALNIIAHSKKSFHSLKMFVQ